MQEQKNFITKEEYLKLERASAEKHQYYKGEIFGMSGNKIDVETFNEVEF